MATGIRGIRHDAERGPTVTLPVVGDVDLAVHLFSSLVTAARGQGSHDERHGQRLDEERRRSHLITSLVSGRSGRPRLAWTP